MILGYHTQPDRLHIDTIDSERDSILFKLQTTIEELITSYLQKYCSWMQHSNSQVCDYLSSGSYFLSELVRLDLWPIHNIRLSTFSGRLLELDPARVCNGQWNRDYDIGNHCQAHKINLISEVQQTVEEMRELHAGLCLRCVKQGRVTEDEGSCRYYRKILCTYQHLSPPLDCPRSCW